jgi:ABC-2 type transport system ATP-binding protein
MHENAEISLKGGKLISEKKGVYEFEADVTRTPIKHLLRQISDTDGVKDVEINKAPIEQVIAELYNSWR